MQVISADDIHTVNEVMYGARSDALLNDLRTGLSSYDHSILTDLGRQYEANVYSNFEAVSGWKVVNAVRKAVAQVNGFDAPKVILPIYSEEGFKTAPLQMQRFLMADVDVRHLYHKHKIDGWSDTYVDSQPKYIGADHYDYRVSNSGVVERIADEEGNVTYKVTNYYHEMRKGDAVLSNSEKLDIKRSANFLKSKLVRGCKDLTDLYGGEVS